MIDTSTEEAEIEYREILSREKNCDLPVHAEIASGLLEYAYRLRSSAMHTDTHRTDEVNDRSSAANSMTYRQSALWIKPILGVIEKSNHNFVRIRQIEQERQ